MWALIVEELGLDQEWQWVSGSQVVPACMTRVMAIPAVNEFIKRSMPWLAAAPPAYEGMHEA
ncbi:hypothetical protein I6N91_03185 [Arthrobacter sp. MSA 4-2]|uniref:hypothetical protein n=1 Tax=Arthrobacter sp. MSA 4-2 TaxID=2794349 RepID=UPI0018E73D18|nr:hypothetical protein [Arthrobacter sp. MSA 4-2]MBJ2119978.1 hypothetical protein [Arthrobacter sp. MSA 4-2]